MTTLERIEGRVEKAQQSIDESSRQEQQHHEEVMAGLSAGQKAILDAINRDKGVPLEALRQILQQLGETTAAGDPIKIERKLREKADEYAGLREELARLSGDDPQVKALRNEAQKALDASDFALAPMTTRPQVHAPGSRP